MQKLNTAIAVLSDHLAPEAAIKKLAQGGFDLKALSIVGKGYRSEEEVVGFYNVGDRITTSGSRGAFWGASGACSSAAPSSLPLSPVRSSCSAFSRARRSPLWRARSSWAGSARWGRPSTALASGKTAFSSTRLRSHRTRFS